VKQGVRLRMADRLIARQMLLGKTRGQVVEMLGEPTSTAYFRDWDMVYWLGPERGFFRIDSEWLVLKLGANGRVVENRIVRD
jgi:outer membrane protein assembly factor BamE (lipoprotein component of BamABCDE complex)